ncbi:D-sedoheptulose 7-phosphate isomerase [Malonomonas rubra]|uniref:D-sedoheptulose 7-phosphate isomerase n=1 Tax=Malonomonas rubra TaxID=57040 RepID=UPI0026E965B1|nr:D-sedoheptulose 7-phosphate isomerase [Malonomonas rubra]
MDTSLIKQHMARHQQVIELVALQLSPAIAEAARLTAEALANGNKVLVMGNGGSAADAQHLAAELVGRFLRERRALPAIALTTDTSILTAVGNDYGFEQVFSRQVEALAQPGDVVIGISTSGNSPNVLAALVAARAADCRTIGLLGRDGGSIAGQVDLALVVPVQETPHIQESHVTIIHVLCDLVERELFNS